MGQPLSDAVLYDSHIGFYGDPARIVRRNLQAYDIVHDLIRLSGTLHI